MVFTIDSPTRLDVTDSREDSVAIKAVEVEATATTHSVHDDVHSGLRMDHGYRGGVVEPAVRQTTDYVPLLLV
jgi:hypothetical protein